MALKRKSYKSNKSVYAWINRILDKTSVDPKQLHSCIGKFSNKKKKKVMAEKNITSSEYERRRKFLFRAFCILEDEYL